MNSNPLNKLQVLAMADNNQIRALSSLIEEVQDNSDFIMQRRKVIFKNGYSLSVIFGYGSYGSKQGLFEVAAINPNGDWCTQLIDDVEDDVIGYCANEDVVRYMFKLGNL